MLGDENRQVQASPCVQGGRVMDYGLYPQVIFYRSPFHPRWYLSAHAFVRRHFAKRFEHIVQAEIAKGKAHVEAGSGRVSFGRRFSRGFSLREHLTSGTNRDSDKQHVDKKGEKKRQGFFTKKAFRTLRPDMIRRMDDAPKPVGPNGWISEEPVVVPPSRPRSASFTVAELAHAKDLSNTK